MIHDCLGKDGSTSYLISSRQVWLPGVYDSHRAARYAFRFPDEVLQALQDEVNEKEEDYTKRVITFEMLQKAHRLITTTDPLPL